MAPPDRFETRGRLLLRLMLFAALPLGATAVTCGCGDGGGDGLVRPPATSATPGMGVPAEGSGWEVTLVDAREERTLEGGEDMFNAETYAPKAGLTFLVADVILRNLEADREAAVSTDDFAVSSEDGRVFTPQGHRSSSPGPFSQPYQMGVTGTIVNLVSNELDLSLVFIVDKDAVGQAFTLRFLEVPPMPFSVRHGPGSTSTPPPAPIPSATSLMP